MIYSFSLRQWLVRIGGFIALAACWYFAFWWGAIPLTLLYMWRYAAYELIFLGILIDIQFLPGTIFPYYTTVFTAFVCLALLLKPFVRPRTATYEIE